MTLLPFDDRDGVIWHNGELVPWRESRLHVLSHGLHYASCVFEGERVYNGNIFKLREHTERLFNSARTLGMELPVTMDEVDAACNLVVATQGLKDAYVRPVAWRGSEMMAVSAQHARVHLAIAAWEWPSYFNLQDRLEGIRLKTSAWRRPAPDTAPTDTKAAGLYMICTLSKHEAEAAGYHDALMLDYRGLIAEATGANIFLVQDGVIHTPIPDCFLDGITRRTVMELAKARQFKIVERHIEPEELARTQEVFLTGTAAEVTAVSEIDGRSFTVSDITRTLIADYDKLVRGPGAGAASSAA
jgi:branched-chain amino acid aminotransferase